MPKTFEEKIWMNITEIDTAENSVFGFLIWILKTVNKK